MSDLLAPAAVAVFILAGMILGGFGRNCPTCGYSIGRLHNTFTGPPCPSCGGRIPTQKGAPR